MASREEGYTRVSHGSRSTHMNEMKAASWHRGECVYAKAWISKAHHDNYLGRNVSEGEVFTYEGKDESGTPVFSEGGGRKFRLPMSHLEKL